MFFSRDQLDFYREHGYVSVPDLFNEREISGIRAELDRFKRHGLLRNVSTEADGKTHTEKRMNLQVIPTYDKSNLLRAAAFHNRVVEAVTEILGEPVILHLDQIFLKPAKHGAGTAWHQDNAYFKISDSMKGVGVWTAVHKATVENGTMHVVPDLFSTELEHTRDANSDHHIRCFVDENAAVPVELPAGGALFFCYGTPHCTLGNNTEQERAGFALHFLREDFAQPELVEPDRTCRPLINGPNATGGLREYGETVIATWERELERVLEAVPA
jgi:ectoine hydroxylase-related dioxygenase (phytanoyl-CoA dioxygenase family)